MGVYVHFPWCLSKCGYCDFYSVATGGENVIEHERYADQILFELERRVASIAQHQLTTIFVGGGTPSLWNKKALARVLSGALSLFGAAAKDVEITVECNPSSFDADAVEGLLLAQVNRISLGIQSLNNEQLTFLGRRHDAAGALRALELALDAGFSSVSADLLFGLPRQTVNSEVDQVRQIAEMGVDHLSAYALTIEDGTHFGQLKKLGRLPLAVDENVADAFLAVHSTLESLDFEHYEVSNFARPGKRSLHNQQYWWGLPYLGVGAAAWGTVPLGSNLVRYRNPAHIERYLGINFTAQATSPFEPTPKGTVDSREFVDAKMRLSERLLLGLRLKEGVELEMLERELGIPVLTAERMRAIRRQIERRNLCQDGGRIYIEPEAWLHADSTIVDIA